MQPEKLSEEIDRCVAAALADIAPLEELIGRLVLGRLPQPEDDGWERWQLDFFFEAVLRWSRLRSQRRRGVRRRTSNETPPELEAVWLVVFTFAESAWWDVPALSWPKLGAQLSLGERSAQWYLTQMGWQFAGMSQKQQRTIVRAPCIECSTPSSAEDLSDDGVCARCQP